MDKIALEKVQKDIEVKFGETSRQAELLQVELVKLQGEHRLVKKLIEEFDKKKAV